MPAAFGAVTIAMGCFSTSQEYFHAASVQTARAILDAIGKQTDGYSLKMTRARQQV
jgi:hypothetical protein